MKNLLVILFLLSFGSVFCQSIEDAIYNATDTFNAKKSPEALAALNKNIANFESKLTSIEEYMAFIYLLVNKAYYLDKNNKNSTAISTYEKAWKLYKDKNIASSYDFDIIENCLKPLGILYNRVGDYLSSENITKSYIDLAKNNNDSNQVVAGIINLSRLYQTLGKHQQSIKLANYGLNIKKINAQQKRILKGIKSRSEIRLNRDVIIIDNVISPLKTFGNIQEKELIYELAMQNKDYAKALKVFKSLKNLKRDQLSSASLLSKLYFQEAQLYFLLNDFKTAESTLKIALKYLLPDYNSKSILSEDNLYPENTFIEIFDLYAALQSNPEKALEYYNLSFYVSDLLAMNTTSQEGKFILLNEYRSRSEKCLDLLYKLQNSSNKSNYTLQALKLSERYKSKVLKETVEKKNLVKLYPEDSLLILQQRLLQEQQQLTNRLYKTPFKDILDSKTIIREQLASINIELKKVNKDVEKKYKRSQSSFSISALNSRLKEDQATLVNYFYGKKAIYQIIVSEQATAFNKILLSKENTKNIKNFINYFESSSSINNNILNFTEDAYSIYKLLKLDIIKDKSNLIIIPDGFINFIPFDALLTAKTETEKFDSMPFFVKFHQSVFNASVLLYINNALPKNKHSVLGVFPVFKDTSQELSYSLDESKNLKKEIKTTLLMHANATKSNFLKQARKHSILHLSTHGTGGDFFNPAQIAFIDEPLSINELYSINLNPELVVLSACETGVGELKRGEGALSIARGFQYAGAKKVLYSLWQISDLSTSKIMTSFYRNLDNTTSISFANHQSKIEYLNNKDISNIKKSPYYWSAFTLYGGFDQVEHNYFNKWLIIGISIVIILFLLFLYKRNNGKRSVGIST
ncbi:MAG: CHAT domain-containing protein [Lacinutrix venerupis]